MVSGLWASLALEILLVSPSWACGMVSRAPSTVSLQESVHVGKKGSVYLHMYFIKKENLCPEPSCGLLLGPIEPRGGHIALL